MVNFFHNPSCAQYQHSEWQYYEETQHTGHYADDHPDDVQHPSTELIFRIELICFLAHSTDIIAYAQQLSMMFGKVIWKCVTQGRREPTLCVRLKFRILI